jgi:hypothetical protein
MSSTSAAPAASDRPRRVEHALVFVLGAAIMWWAYGGWARPDEGVPGNDSFYHIKMASMMPQAAALDRFPWSRFSYFTREGDSFVNHHYGFHLALSLSVRLSNWLTGSYLPGGRWAVYVFFGFLTVVMHRLATCAITPWRWIWLPLLVLLPFQFFTRHAFVRAMTPSLLFMLLTLLFMFQRKYIPLAISVAVYIHLYMGGVIFAPLLVASYVLSIALCGGDRGVMIRVIAWSLAAWVVGILTHPYRHGMLGFLQLQVFETGLSPDISVGKEWRPYTDLWWFMRMSGALLAVWIAAVGARLRMGQRMNVEELTLLVLNVAFFILTAKARRFIEYWPAFCLLSAVFLARPCFEPWAARLRRGSAPLLSWACFGLTFILMAFAPQWREIQRGARCDFDLPAIKSAMTFVAERSEPGEIVFTDDWDIFPLFFFYNSHNHYIVGLDPKFTHARRPDLWERYVKITRGKAPAQAGVDMPDGTNVQIRTHLQDIRDHFHARWVVTDRDHQALAAQLAAAPDFAELVYPTTSYGESHDAPYLVFRVRMVREGEAPAEPHGVSRAAGQEPRPPGLPAYTLRRWRIQRLY